MGCTFCATGKSGFSRNLTPSEMLAQIQSAQKDNNIRISNIVLMGMGEPLDNFDNVIKFLSLVSSDKGITFDGLRFPSTWYLSWAPNSGNTELIDITASGTDTAFDRTITIDINGVKVD